MKKKIISLKWKLILPLLSLFFIMALAIIYITSDIINKSTRKLSNQQVENVLYLVQLNIDNMYKNLLYSKIKDIINTKNFLKFINNEIAIYINHNKNNLNKTYLNKFISRYKIFNSYFTFHIILKKDKIIFNSNHNIKFRFLLTLHDLKGRSLKNVISNILKSHKSEFIIFKYKTKMIIGYLKTYHKEFVVASFMGIQGLQDEIEKEKNNMVNIIQQSMDKIKIATSGYLFILSSDNFATIFPTLNSSSIGTKFKFKIKPQIVTYLSKKESYEPANFYFDVNGERYITSIRYFRPLKWYIGSVIPEKDILMPGIKLIKIQAMVVISIFFASLLIVLLIITRTIAPLKRLTHLTAMVAEHDFSKGSLNIEEDFKKDVHRRDEVGALTSSFLEMQDKLEKNVTTLLNLTAQQERLESELRIAREIQMGILPPFEPKPPFSNIDFYAYLQPAREVGGDLFHYFFIDKKRFCFAVGDVSDKGVPAAFFMAMTMTLLKNSAMSQPDIGKVITSINNELCQNNPNNMFVTLFAGILNLDTGQIQYVNAGHNPVIHIPVNKKPYFLKEISGPVIGAMEGMDYETFSLRLLPGDQLFLYTDGVTEAMDGEKNLYGEDRLINILSYGIKGISAQKIVQTVLDDLKKFTGKAPQSDDITIMVMRWFGDRDN